METQKNRRGRVYNSPIFPRKMYVFVVPALTMFLVFWIFPVFQMFFYSVTDFNGVNYRSNFVGMKNFMQLFKEGTMMNSISNTLIYTLLIVIGTNVIGLALAMVLNIKLAGKAVFRTGAFLPTLFSAIVVGFIWSYVYMPDSGMIASVLNLFGLNGSNFNILGNMRTALYGIAIVDIWKSFGTTMIIYLAGLQTVDENLLEAGRIDGCTEWQLIYRIKLPLISSTVTINVILSVIAGLKAFDYAFIMTNGGPGKATNTLMFTIYKIAFTDQMMGKASALSVVSFFVIILITIGMLVFMNRREVEL